MSAPCIIPDRLFTIFMPTLSELAEI